MGEWKLLPLGIDLGSRRVRIALGEANRAGDVRLRAIIGRDLPDAAACTSEVVESSLVAALLEDMLAEVGCREQRCVLALGAPASVTRVVRFPKMSRAERLRAAHFEAQRFAGWDIDDGQSLVRTHPLDREAGAYVVGVTRVANVDSRVNTMRMAGLHVVAVDHDAFAMRRMFPDCDAIVDIGAERSSLHVFGAIGPVSLVTQYGGAAVTRGIAAELSIDIPTAERRKRILGCAGAGVSAREEVVASIVALIDRARGRTTIDRVALTGNGSRLPNLARALEDATGAISELPVAALLRTANYPEDVLRAAAPDWTLAASLAAWSAVA